MSVLEYLSGRGVAFLVLPSPSSHRTDETASRHGIDPDEVVRTVVVMHSRFGPALAVIPAVRDLDEDLLRAALHDDDAHIATDRELAMHFPDRDPSSIPPLGLYHMLPLYVDPAVLERKQIVFAAGRPSLAICMAPAELFRDDPIVIVALTPESVVPEPEQLPRVDPKELLPVHMADVG